MRLATDRSVEANDKGRGPWACAVISNLATHDRSSGAAVSPIEELVGAIVEANTYTVLQIHQRLISRPIPRRNPSAVRISATVCRHP